MPGMFGAVGVTGEVRTRVEAAFASVFYDADQVHCDDLIIGSHAHGRRNCVIRAGELTVAVDGEVSLYERLDHAPPLTQLFAIDTDGVALTSECRGNVAVWDHRLGTLYLGTEWSGSFPVYFVQLPNGGLMFASRLRALALAADPEVDALGVCQFLQSAYFLSDRTQWKPIRRLQPGQSLSFTLSTQNCSIVERSRLWAGRAPNASSREAISTEGWELIRTAVKSSLGARSGITLMSSGGWDSRTVLAGSLSTFEPSHLIGYTHGDGSSREVRLARQIINSVGVQFHFEPLDPLSFDTAVLHSAFDAEEHVIFPHWVRAGAVAGASRVVTAGTYGEVMGGHYGRGMLLTGIRQMLEVLGSIVGLHEKSRDLTSSDIRTVIDFLSVGGGKKPWVVTEDWWQAAGVTAERWRADIEADVLRLRGRGVIGLNQLIEAFVSEHRGSQYINAQLRAARVGANIAIPLGDRSILEWATQLPLHTKIHNRVNRAVLAKYFPRLLDFPMAATLVNARRPLVVQELSRLTRKGIEVARKRRPISLGPVRAPRLSWVNFDFLRTGIELKSIVDDLRGEMWDRKALRRHLDALARDSRISAHSTADHFLKVYNLDLGMRRG